MFPHEKFTSRVRVSTSFGTENFEQISVVCEGAGTSWQLRNMASTARLAARLKKTAIDRVAPYKYGMLHQKSRGRLGHEETNRFALFLL
jgi:hypothetical protein